MRLTFIVTIDPIKDVSLLNILVHSLNLQTTKEFNVIFNNQTLMGEGELFSKLCIKPTFDYLVYNINKEYFLGKYPIWDLYEVHNLLLDDNVLNEYFISLHMEEFLDVDYAEMVIKVLENNDFDILFGNLSRTRMDYDAIKPILATQTEEEFSQYLKHKGLRDSYHWSFNYGPLFYSRNINLSKQNAMKLFFFWFKRRLKPTSKGYTTIRDYIAEDLYFMKRDFAKQYNWFLRGHRMYFEDIHICEKKRRLRVEQGT
jgi:hypothetical protein